MIIQFFPNPNNKKSFYSKHVQPVVDNVLALPVPNQYTYSQNEIVNAGKKNISVQEFCRRDRIVKAEHQACPYFTGDTVYPHSKELYERFGQCKVIGICKTYADFGDVEWPKNDLAFIVQVQPLKSGQQRINATVGYFSIKEPTE